jgi:hypothetical protein
MAKFLVTKGDLPGNNLYNKEEAVSDPSFARKIETRGRRIGLQNLVSLKRTENKTMSPRVFPANLIVCARLPVRSDL